MSRRGWAERILDRALPDGPTGDAIRGDLRQERDRRRARHGEARASRWHLRQALGIWLFATRDGLLGRGWSDGRSASAPQRSPGVVRSGGDGPVRSLARELRHATRALARAPGFALPALLILAIGLTAATAIFTVVDGIVFRPLGLPGSERLVVVCEDHARLQGSCIASPGNTEDFRRQATTLSDLGIGRGWPFSLSDSEGTRGVRGGLATAGFLRALEVRPDVGRIFRDEEVGPGRDRVVLLSHAFWTTRYGASPSIVGSSVRLDGEAYDVIGVLPRGLDLPFDLDRIELWKPPHFDPLDPEVRGWRGFRAIGRLADGASLPAASAQLTSLYAAIGRAHEEVDDEWRLRVEPLLSAVVGDTRPVLMAFLGAAGLLLLIVCANVANLLLARGMDRRRELALRATLGADRRRLVAGILTESLVLTALAAALALVLASGATRLLVALAPPEIPRLDEVALDARILVFSAFIAVGATLVFALLPAARVTRWSLGEALRSGGRVGASRQATGLRSGLVMAELALATVLLTAAALLTRTFAGYLEWEPGFDRAGLLAVSAFVDMGAYPTRAAFTEFWRTAEEELRDAPGIDAVATASAGPLFGGGDGATSYRVAGMEEREVLPSVAWYDVGPAYFSALGLPVVRGREITEDDDARAAPAAVVNEALARTAGLEGDVLGRTVVLPELGLELRVVGVVADVPPMTPGAPPRPEIYWSNRQLGRPATFFLIRTRGDPAESAGIVTETLQGLDPDLALGTPQTLERAEARALVGPRFQALVLLAFALAALALSAVGVYAVVSYAVGQRVREMGIRMALGAAASDIVRMVLRSSLGVAVAGVAIGLVASAWVRALLEGMIPGVRSRDPLSLAVPALLLLSAAALSALVPVRRALRADPLRSIRSD